MRIRGPQPNKVTVAIRPRECALSSHFSRHLDLSHRSAPAIDGGPSIPQQSPPIFHCTASTDRSGKDSVSVRECFLYLAKLASSDLYEYPKTYGKDLVCPLPRPI
jgi:hypothetical protein